MQLIVSSQQMVDRAMARIHTLEPEEAIALHALSEALFVDLREPHEITCGGAIPGSISVPRGTLEFRVDPKSAFFLEAFGHGRPLILYCQLSARSALATLALMDMGIKNVGHIGGGFVAWKEAGGPILV